ncbi:MAG TPA: restriction endonuclease subunit S [Nitrosomonas sp.]|nr:restriction endonuclease subunit S [Nitrosomonas sp.]
MNDQDSIDKKSLSERDICTKFITPAIKDVAGWNIMQFSEQLTLGNIFVKGKRVARGSKDRADYILFHNRDLPIVIIEAKDNNHDLGGLNKSALSHLLTSETPEEFNQHWDFIAEHFDLLFQTPEHVAPLRQSILELAVRGKLTRREAGDESAGELLQQIHDEKANRGKEEPQPVVKEANKPFALPENWEWTTLDYMSKKITDGEHIRPQITSAGVYFLSAKDVRDDGPHFENALFVSVEDAEQYRKRCDPERGDILVVSRGATVGRTCIVDTDEVFCLLGSVILAKPEIGISSEYITFAMKSNDVQRQLVSSSGATAQQAIYIRDIRKTLIPLPPLAEQERIVKRVEQLLSLCDALEARLQSAEEERGRLVAAVMAGVGTTVEY